MLQDPRQAFMIDLKRMWRRDRRGQTLKGTGGIVTTEGCSADAIGRVENHDVRFVPGHLVLDCAVLISCQQKADLKGSRK